MSVSYPPAPASQGNNSATTTVPASTTPVTLPANANRISALISNFANRPAWVIFGVGIPTAGATNTLIVPAAASGQPGVLDVPDDYDGPIQVVWTSGVATGGNNVLVLTEILP
jgi:hypothetical protein